MGLFSILKKRFFHVNDSWSGLFGFFAVALFRNFALFNSCHRPRPPRRHLGARPFSGTRETQNPPARTPRLECVRLTAAFARTAVSLVKTPLRPHSAPVFPICHHLSSIIHPRSLLPPSHPGIFIFTPIKHKSPQIPCKSTPNPTTNSPQTYPESWPVRHPPPRSPDPINFYF